MRRINITIGVFSAFIFSLGFGYITALSPHYAKFFVGSEYTNVKILQRVEKVNCGNDDTCEDHVSLSWTTTDQTPSSSTSALVLGRLWNTATISCSSKLLAQYGEPMSVSLSRETFNQFYVISGGELRACQDRNIDISVFYSRGQRKGGFIDGLPYFTSTKEAQIIKNFSRFVQEDLKLINFCVAIVILLFSILIRIVTVDSTSGVRIKMAILSLLLASAQSGLIEIWIPFYKIATLTRWFSSITFCVWLCYALIYIGNLQRFQIALIRCSAALVALLFLVTRSQVDTLISFSSIGFLASVTLFIIEGTGAYLFFCLLLGLSVLEFSGFRIIHSGYTAPTFIAGLIAIENYRALLSFLKVNRILKLTTLRKFEKKAVAGKKRGVVAPLGHYLKGFTFSEQKSDSFSDPETVPVHKYVSNRVRNNTLHAIIKLFQRQFQISRVTILNLTDPQLIQIYQYTGRSSIPKRIKTNTLPAIFAHVISTGNALVNVHENSSLVESLRRGAPYNGFSSKHFTVLPIFAGTETIGAIALTEYNSEQFRTSLNYSTFIFCLDILRSLLVEHLLNTPKTESLRKLAILTEQLSKGLPESVKNPADLLDHVGFILHNAFGWRVMPGILNRNDNLLQIREAINFDEGVRKQILQGKIYAHKDNRQGPLALAVHEKVPMIVPNVKWIEGVVHSNTMKFFGVHGTKTAAFVPVLDSSSRNDARVFGVFWIEGVRQSEINYSDRELFLSLMKYLADTTERLKSKSELDHSLDRLADFIPRRLLDKFLAGENVEEQDFGYLMMIDLKGSTPLAHSIGNESFRSEITILREQLKLELEQKSFVLQQSEWDSFYFTFSLGREQSPRVDIEKWVSLINPIILRWKEGLLNKFGDKHEIQATSYRVCFSYGDLSRGIVDDGETKTWTFVGNAIAIVSKVEQASKALPGQVFSDESVVKFSTHDWIELATTSHSLTIYGLSKYLETAKIEKAA